MIILYKYFNFSCFIALTIILFFNNLCNAQDSISTKEKTIDRAEIQWLSQWPSPESKTQKKRAIRQIKNFIFGKKTDELKRPVALIVLNKNLFWILDQENNTLFQVGENIGKTPRFVEKKKFSSLVGICKFQGNKMLFTDSYLNKIYLLDPDKKQCVVLNDTLKLNKITGIAYSELKNEIWVLETGEHKIVVLNEKGEIIKKMGSRGIDKGEFNFPTHISIDKKGNVYIVDAMNFRVQVINKEDSVISVFGSNGDATGYFACPKGIATDSYGNIYVVDALFNAIQIFDIEGKFLYTFGTQGQEAGQFWMPTGIFIDTDDKIYIADSYNSRIQIFQLIAGGKQ